MVMVQKAMQEAVKEHEGALEKLRGAHKKVGDVEVGGVSSRQLRGKGMEGRGGLAREHAHTYTHTHARMRVHMVTHGVVGSEGSGGQAHTDTWHGCCRSC